MNVTYEKDKSTRSIRARTTEQLRKDARFLNRIRVKAPSRRVEPLDGEEFDDLSDEQRSRIRESM